MLVSIKAMKLLVSLLSLVSAASCTPAMGELSQHSAVLRRQSVNRTVLTYHPASDPNGVGVLVLPGGAYSHTAMDKEGYQPAVWLNERGYDAWILDYATANNTKTPLYPLPQDQALEAIEHIRAKHSVSKLGIWGFSAGGHLAATTVTNTSADLDFGVLAYPVITLESQYTHKESRKNLIGSNPSPELVWRLSAENRVSNSTPPVFLFHTANDDSVPVQNTLLFANAMATHARQFQTLILPNGGHGLGLALSDPVRTWTEELERFLKYSI